MSNYWIIIIIGIITIAGFLTISRFIKSTRYKKPTSKKITNEEKTTLHQTGIQQFVAVEARVYDNETRTIFNATIPGDTVKHIREKYGNLGRKWLRDGQWLYALNRLEGGIYKPVDVPMTLNDPPSELYRALQQDETAITYDMKETQGILQKYGHIIWIGAIAAVIIFILMANVLNGK
jgi:hypothetical protein